MSSEETKLEKGARVAIVGGRQGVGTRGEIFWIGENKYGPGMRYGVRGDNGETYWLDADKLGPESAAPAAPDGPAKPVLAKGQRVEITRGPGSGTQGEVFWVGDSKFGKGMRYGVKDDAGETHWVDEQQVDAIEGGPPPKPKSGAPAGHASGHEPPMPSSADDFEEAPLDFGDDDGGGGGFDDEAPFPDDDVPF
ncbi:MAG: hypothetical protein AB7S26_28500 [Sandaracinaceae bacterium]